MIEPYHVFLQAFPFSLLDLQKMNPRFPFSLARYKVGIKQFYQLGDGSKTSVRKTIELFVRNPVQRGKKVVTTICIINILYVNLCLIDIQLIVEIGRSIKRSIVGILTFWGALCLYNFLIKGSREGR